MGLFRWSGLEMVCSIVDDLKEPAAELHSLSVFVLSCVVRTFISEFIAANPCLSFVLLIFFYNAFAMFPFFTAPQLLMRFPFSLDSQRSRFWPLPGSVMYECLL